MIEISNIIASSPVLSSTVILLSLYAIYRYYVSKYNYWESQGVPTVNVSLYKRLYTHWFVWQKELVEKNGKIFGTYDFTKPVLYLSEPELIRDVLVKDFHIFGNRRGFRTGTDPLVDNMLSVVEGDQWKKIRTIMSPTFSNGKLRKMLPLIDECIDNLISNLDNISQSDKECDMKRVMGAYTMEVVIQVAFGTKVDALSDESNPIIVNARKIFSRNISPRVFVIILAPKLAKLLKLSFLDSNITKFFKEFVLKIIDERKKLPKDKKRIDFLQLMLDSMETNETPDDNEEYEDKPINKEKYMEMKDTVPIEKKVLTSDEFVAQCVLFLLAGYETTATTISMTILNIANNLEVQQKLYFEAKKYFEQNKEVSNYETLHSLKYLDAVIAESQRLMPAALFLERVPNQDYSLGQTGILIKKGHVVHVPVFALHRDPDHFKDPDTFKPERFLADNVVHHPYAYLPFGAGPRNCIGMRLAQLEVKLALVNLVYKYKFSSSKPIDFYFSGGLIVPKEVLIKVEKR